MRWFLIALLLAVPLPSMAQALSLEWDPVTVSSEGVAPTAGSEVTSYNVYSCQVSPCLKATGAVLIGSVLAPATRFDISTQVIPMSYAVTSVNIVGESTESDSVRAVKAGKPGKPRVKK